MTKTEHYQLPQWEATDPVRREDFNQAFAEMDAGLEAKAEQAALEAYRTGNDAAVAALDSKINSVSAAAESAQACACAAWSPQNPFFVTGSYRGTGAEGKNVTLKITVGFRPSVIIISNGNDSYAAFGPDQRKLHHGLFTWDSDGITLTDADPEYRMDQLNITYCYCAFR